MSTFAALMYHNLAPRPEHEYAVTPDRFREQLRWLGDQGFVAEGLPELHDRLASKQALPRRYAVLTFDDGHKSNLLAAEIVREAGFQATFFLTRDACRNRAEFLDEAEIRELSRLCSVGSHGVTHQSLLKLAPRRVLAELSDSKAWLEDLLAQPVPWFSAPGGDIDAAVVRQALDCGYSLVGNSREWLNRHSAVAGSRTVNRIMIFRAYDLRQFGRIVRLELPFLVRRRLRSGLVALAKRALSEKAIHRLSRFKRRLRRR